jgi:hypothetical protein
MADRREELRTIGASAVMVRLAGAVPSRSADTIRGERNASGASSRMWRSTFASRRAIAAKLAARPCAKSSIHSRALAIAIRRASRRPGLIGVPSVVSQLDCGGRGGGVRFNRCALSSASFR